MKANAQVTPIRGRIPHWSFEDRIRKVRREIGYTQDEMAEALEVGLKAYSAWESGKNTPGDILTIAARFEKISGVPRQWFIGWMNDEPVSVGPEGLEPPTSTVISRELRPAGLVIDMRTRKAVS